MQLAFRNKATSNNDYWDSTVYDHLPPVYVRPIKSEEGRADSYWNCSPARGAGSSKWEVVGIGSGQDTTHASPMHND